MRITINQLKRIIREEVTKVTHRRRMNEAMRFPAECSIVIDVSAEDVFPDNFDSMGDQTDLKKGQNVTDELFDAGFLKGVPPGDVEAIVIKDPGAGGGNPEVELRFTDYEIAGMWYDNNPEHSELLGDLEDIIRWVSPKKQKQATTYILPLNTRYAPSIRSLERRKTGTDVTKDMLALGHLPNVNPSDVTVTITPPLSREEADLRGTDPNERQLQLNFNSPAAAASWLQGWPSRPTADDELGWRPTPSRTKKGR